MVQKSTVQETPAEPEVSHWLVDGIPTRIYQWKAIHNDGQKKYMLFFIPGNPGHPNYYKAFLSHLYHQSNCTLSIVCMNHAGQIPLTQDKYEKEIWNEECYETKKYQKRRNGTWLYNLDEQLNHKLLLLKELMTNDYHEHELILSGHSVGAWLAYEMLSRIKVYKPHSVILLFPTLEEIRDTTNGNRLYMLFFTIPRLLMTLLAFFLYYFVPDFFRLILIQLLSGDSLKMCQITNELIRPYIVGNILYVSRDEMNRIAEWTVTQKDTLAEYKDRLWFYYGSTDPWVPLSHYTRMKQRMKLPGHVMLCREGMEHAFVLQSSPLMAKVMYESILTEKVLYQ